MASSAQLACSKLHFHGRSIARNKQRKTTSKISVQLRKMRLLAICGCLNILVSQPFCVINAETADTLFSN